MVILRKGSKGEDVKLLQKKLNLIEDGIFGPLTEEAVKAFQVYKGLEADGIVGAKTWAALGVNKFSRNIRKIIVHCTATPEGEDRTVEQVRQMHLHRGFSDIGYHWLIYRDGSVNKGRDESKSGAHTLNHNYDSIGVSYVGGCVSRDHKDWTRKPKDTRTPEQKASLLKLLKELKVRYPGAKVYGHRDFANKACPSFDATKEFMDI